MTIREIREVWKISAAQWGAWCSGRTTNTMDLKLNRIQSSSLEIFINKKMEIEKTKTTFIISVLKVEYKVILFFSICNFFY